MVKERKLAIPKTTAFICTLPEGTQNIIRDDLKQHAREHHYILIWDRDAKDYEAMTRRFCDISDIYKDTQLEFCEVGEDIEAYERSQQREIVLKLKDIDAEKLSKISGRVGISVSELLNNFVSDLIGGERTNGSDERMFANRWFERCWFSLDMYKNFLSFLVEMEYVDRALELWDELEDYKQQDDLDKYDLREKEWLQEELDKLFQEYKELNADYSDSFDNEMKNVLAWKEERDKIMGRSNEHMLKNR